MKASAAAVKASTAWKTSASVKAAKTAHSPGGVRSRDAPMVEPTEGAGSASAESGAPHRSAMEAGAAAEARSPAAEAVPIDDGRAVRDIRVVVVNDSPAVMPIVPPMAPAPAEPAEEADTEPQSKSDP